MDGEAAKHPLKVAQHATKGFAGSRKLDISSQLTVSSPEQDTEKAVPQTLVPAP